MDDELSKGWLAAEKRINRLVAQGKRHFNIFDIFDIAEACGILPQVNNLIAYSASCIKVTHG